MTDNNIKELLNFFSISEGLILTDVAIPYDLYINSSTLQDKVHFVKAYKRGEILSRIEIRQKKEKYYQFYLHENDRANFLASLVHISESSDIQKADFIKESSIRYLDQIFARKKELNTPALTEIINECMASVKAMVELIKGKDVADVQKIISSVSYHDFYTYDHSINVSMYCISLFSTLKPNATTEEITMAGMAGLLHDIGKILVPTHILNKPDKLTSDEMDVIIRHPKIGHDLLANIKCNCSGVDLDLIRRVILEHHENYNGTGYPNKIDGAQIHILSRLTSICDFFDAITTKRAYHQVLSVEKALALMSHSKGKKIDPKIFDVFAKKIDYLTFKAKLDMVLPEDFDPCQPTNVLPLRELKPHFKVEHFDRQGDEEKSVATNIDKKKKAI